MGPEMYDLDDQLMDELGGAMDGYDSKQIQPAAGTNITISISPAGTPPSEDTPATDDESREGMLPTPEELEELIKSANA